VEVSELLSRMMQVKKIPHNVLNAKQHAREAQIVQEAGMPGNITIATNMAGRGTDIKLGPGVKEAGGLAIIGTEKHESRRVDRQLRGRAGRQGDPGSTQFYISLEDDLMRMFGSERIASLMDRMGYKEGEVIQHSMITRSIERAQKKVEENNFGIRKRLLEYDDVMNKQRNVVYTKRQHALFGDRLALDLDNAFYAVAEDLVNGYQAQNNFEDFKLAVIVNFGIETAINEEDLQKGNTSAVASTLYEEAIGNYNRKKNEMMKQALPVFQNVRTTQGTHIENVIVPFTNGTKGLNVIANLDKTINTGGAELAAALERTITLAMIDDTWKEHLRAMDDLKQSVQTAVYEQKDPLVIYKTTAFELFSNMNSELNRDIVSFLCYAGIPIQENASLKEGREEKTDMSKMKVKKEELVSSGGEPGIEQEAYHDPSPVKQDPVRVGPKVGRNDPCPCGSGKKFKACHGKDS
jgi:preprotein translocase subunit SecA